MQHLAILYFVLLASGSDFTAAHTAVKDRGFLSREGTRLQPELVAATLGKVEDEWKYQYHLFLECNATATNKVQAQKCLMAPKAFQHSCATIMSAVLKASSGDRDTVHEYMADICSEPELKGWRQGRCEILAATVLTGMSQDNFDNREHLDVMPLCTNFWSRFTAQENAIIQKEEAEREAIEKQKEEEVRAAEARRAEEEAAEAKRRQEYEEREKQLEESAAAAAAAEEQREEAAPDVRTQKESQTEASNSSNGQQNEVQNSSAVADEQKKAASEEQQVQSLANATSQEQAAPNMTSDSPALSNFISNSTASKVQGDVQSSGAMHTATAASVENVQGAGLVSDTLAHTNGTATGAASNPLPSVRNSNSTTAVKNAKTDNQTTVAASKA